MSPLADTMLLTVGALLIFLVLSAIAGNDRPRLVLTLIAYACLVVAYATSSPAGGGDRSCAPHTHGVAASPALVRGTERESHWRAQ